MAHRVLLRFLFGAAASLAAGVISIVYGPVVGGVFLAFPAILPATLTLLERDRGTVAAVRDARGAVAGSLGLIAFAAIVATLGQRTAGAAVLAAAVAGWLVTSFAAYGCGVVVARRRRSPRLDGVAQR